MTHFEICPYVVFGQKTRKSAMKNLKSHLSKKYELLNRVDEDPLAHGYHELMEKVKNRRRD
jgi:hypothetical protein